MKRFTNDQQLTTILDSMGQWVKNPHNKCSKLKHQRKERFNHSTTKNIPCCILLLRFRLTSVIFLTTHIFTETAVAGMFKPLH